MEEDFVEIIEYWENGEVVSRRANGIDLPIENATQIFIRKTITETEARELYGL